MGDQKYQARRVRRIFPDDSASQADYEEQDDFEDEESDYIPSRRTSSIPTRAARYTDAPAAPRSDVAQYLIGGVVSASVLLLLIVVYLMATANKNPTTPAAPANTINNTTNNTNNATDPLFEDVPTVAVPVSIGSPAPGDVPTSNLVVPPSEPTGSPAPLSFVPNDFSNNQGHDVLGR